MMIEETSPYDESDKHLEVRDCRFLCLKSTLVIMYFSILSVRNEPSTCFAEFQTSCNPEK